MITKTVCFKALLYMSLARILLMKGICQLQLFTYSHLSLDVFPKSIVILVIAER